MNAFTGLSYRLTSNAVGIGANYGMSKLNGLAGTIGASDGVVVYKINRPYKSVLVYEAKRLVLAEAIKAIQRIVPDIVNSSIRRRIKERDSKIDETNHKIIENKDTIVEDFGKIETDGGDIYALDIFGREVKTALIISFEGEDNIEYVQTFGRTATSTVPGKQGIIGSVLGNNKNKTIVEKSITETIITKEVVCIDLSPKIDCSSSKNVSLTQVQGRDYSRKEIIGNGDVKFSVSGKFVSRNMDVYPQDQVSRFIEIMRYNGIVKVNNLIFSQHNVKNIIIQEYSLPQTDCLNEQPYSFSCVAVEPDEEVVAQDTISAYEYTQATSSLDGWYNSVLVNKMLQQADAAAGRAIAGLASMIKDF